MNMSSCRIGASGAIASSTSMTNGSTSYCTSISVQRLIGDRLRRGGDGGDGVAFIQRLVSRHDVQRQVAEIHRAFADERFFRWRFRGNPPR